MTTDPERAIVLRRVARDLAVTRSIRDLDRLLSEIVAAALKTVPVADAAGISTTTPGEITPRTELDALQGELAEGPGMTAVHEPPADGTVVVADLAGQDASRWPRFAPRAVDAGYRSMLSCDLSTPGEMRAALNLYAAGPDAFDADSRLTAALFGAQAAVLLHGCEEARSLQRAVDSRDLIGQAKGVLIERFRVDGAGAFEMLVQSSQDTNMKLVDVAHWLLGEAATPGARRADAAPGADRP
jgi:hypothetical protein